MDKVVYIHIIITPARVNKAKRDTNKEPRGLGNLQTLVAFRLDHVNWRGRTRTDRKATGRPGSPDALDR